MAKLRAPTTAPPTSSSPARAKTCNCRWAGCFVAADPAKNWMEDPAAYEEYGYDAQTGGKWWLYNTVIDTMDASNIWVNADGLRFVDENLPGISSRHAVARQPHATCLVVCDATVWNEWMAMPPASYAASVQEQIDIITSDAVGGRVFSAVSTERLADALNESGIATCRVHKANFVKTVEEYNAAAEAGSGADLYPPKASSCTPLVTPPFYAFPIQAAPTPTTEASPSTGTLRCPTSTAGPSPDSMQQSPAPAARSTSSIPAPSPPPAQPDAWRQARQCGRSTAPARRRIAFKVPWTHLDLPPGSSRGSSKQSTRKLPPRPASRRQRKGTGHRGQKGRGS